MHQFQGIDALLELEVLVGELGLVFRLAQLLLNHLLRASSEGREVCTTQEINIQTSVGGLQQPWKRDIGEIHWTVHSFDNPGTTAEVILT